MPRHRIVIIGSGFAGLTAARRLKHANADITILARTSHHLSSLSSTRLRPEFSLRVISHQLRAKSYASRRT